MFALRGIAVCFSIFFLLYSAFSVAVCGVWHSLWRGKHSPSVTRFADLLFAWRMVPFVIATAVTFVFAVPSFLLLEPGAVNESVGNVAAVFGCCGVALVLAGMWNAVLAVVRASRMVMRWSGEVNPIAPTLLDSKISIPVLRTAGVAPPLTAAGILRPRVWLSATAEFVLNDRELQSALRHEAVHVSRRDNLRKLMLRMVAFPGMVELEGAWREATEMAADDAAVSNASEALDLAAAVIKLSRIAPLEPPAELTIALVHSPVESVNARVERLIAWKQHEPIATNRFSSVCALFAAAGLVATLVVSYSQMLALLHTATEWLVR